MLLQRRAPGEAWPLTIDDMLVFCPAPLPAPLLKMSHEHSARALKMHGSIQTYVGSKGVAPPAYVAAGAAHKLLHQAMRRTVLRDELFLQLVKQTRGNWLQHSVVRPPLLPAAVCLWPWNAGGVLVRPRASVQVRSWRLFALVASVVRPSHRLRATVLCHAKHTAAQPWAEAAASATDADAAARRAVSDTVQALARDVHDTLAKPSPERRTVPSLEEVTAAVEESGIYLRVFFVDGTFEHV